jgi:hypothetical protein
MKTLPNTSRLKITSSPVINFIWIVLRRCNQLGVQNWRKFPQFSRGPYFFDYLKFTFN